MTSFLSEIKYPEISAPQAPEEPGARLDMSSTSPSPGSGASPQKGNGACTHPRVQIVAREEDSEFVECKECGEIFESSEFKDMIIEDTKLPKES